MLLLNFKIEMKRTEMEICAKKYGVSSEETLKVSQELDKLLNIFFQNKFINKFVIDKNVELTM
ncbi:aspartyl-phosphate phosphatase Spo0E family protein [Metabacillus bambusae]|uniref:Aspartyl-phosphate phosphatase Spo0E family protein n=1 Tax=Metabacillus bambusae TaxID=2795218 RepID=A0ABS3NAJ7_9BACI|nr:aspartyl-phosphate phosphatase Spo0E family protein [Metabacillus bambusae]MBO1515311.1 aspartyl-phosphate phosphatase Spo0E family protein [Metabacillus bambusae]